MSRSPSSVDLMIAPARLPRRGLLALGLLGLAPFAWRPAHALGEGEAAQGLRAALERGAGVAVDTLGRDGGYLNNPLVRIALPEGRKTYVHLIRGELNVNGQRLAGGDAAMLEHEASLALDGGREAEVLVFDLQP